MASDLGHAYQQHQGTGDDGPGARRYRIAAGKRVDVARPRRDEVVSTCWGAAATCCKVAWFTLGSLGVLVRRYWAESWPPAADLVTVTGRFPMSVDRHPWSRPPLSTRRIGANIGVYGDIKAGPHLAAWSTPHCKSQTIAVCMKQLRLK
jgi:hypothetical protein